MARRQTSPCLLDFLVSDTLRRIELLLGPPIKGLEVFAVSSDSKVRTRQCSEVAAIMGQLLMPSQGFRVKEEELR